MTTTMIVSERIKRLAISSGVGLTLLLVAGGADARRAPKQQLAELEAAAQKLSKSIDSDVQWLFRYQVETGWYRSRLMALQDQWRVLMTRFGVRKEPGRKSSYPAPPRSGFRIDAVVGSQELSFAKARLGAGCKQMRGCKLWLRISFGKEHVNKAARFEVSADLTSSSGRRYAVPTKDFTVKQAVMIVDVPLDRIYLPKGRNSGTVKVLGEQTFKRRRFTLDISR